MLQLYLNPAARYYRLKNKEKFHSEQSQMHRCNAHYPVITRLYNFITLFFIIYIYFYVNIRGDIFRPTKRKNMYVYYKYNRQNMQEYIYIYIGNEKYTLTQVIIPQNLYG